MKCSFLSERHILFARPKSKTYTRRSSEVQEQCKNKNPRLYPLNSESARFETPVAGGRNMKELHARPQAETIAEAIILQAIEDLWSAVHREESVEFFSGEGFAICARIAGMGLHEKLKLVQTIIKAVQERDYIYLKQLVKQDGDIQTAFDNTLGRVNSENTGH